jgi:selenide,water dikinase
MNEDDNVIRLTRYAHGGGCGCKIAPQVLKEILRGDAPQETDHRLLVGNRDQDDAAVYDLGGGQALIATTDFFMPVVDDARDFGRVAAANAISDVYAMGGRPLLALAVLGWPVDKLPAELARTVLEGAREVCARAGIVLAGGHSIDAPEPVFGLSVNGLVDIVNLKRNNTAEEGDLIFMTKPLGVGILSAAQKRGQMEAADQGPFIDQLSTLNNIGERLGRIPAVTAMTDITGFGFLGHLMEMAEGSGLSVEVSYGALPKIPAALKYLKQGLVPDATYRNWNAYQSNVQIAPGVDAMESFMLLPDPQTNGGLMFSVRAEGLEEVLSALKAHGLEAFSHPVGRFVSRREPVISVNP